jgi:hypothetical protein
MESVNKILDAASLHTEKEESRALSEALSAVAELKPEERNEIRNRIAERLFRITSPAGAGLVAVWLGAAVEKGADPKASGRFVISSIIDWSRRLPVPPDDGQNAQEFEIPDIDSDLLRGLEMLGQSAVAHLSRDEDLLISLRNDDLAHQVLTVAEDWSAGAMWMMEILRQRSGKMIVLHGVEQKGYLVQYQNLSNCFHFFTLLQGAFGKKMMPGGKMPVERTLAAAIGDALAEVHDQAWWHYGQGTSPSPALATMVFGEATLDSIEMVEGEQVLLLWPPVLESRGWHGGFFSPFLAAAPPSVRIVDEFKVEIIQEWRGRLKLPDARKRTWWRRFRK